MLIGHNAEALRAHLLASSSAFLGVQVYGFCEAPTRPGPIPALFPAPIHLLPRPCFCVCGMSFRKDTYHTLVVDEPCRGRAPRAWQWRCLACWRLEAWPRRAPCSRPDRSTVSRCPVACCSGPVLRGSAMPDGGFVAMSQSCTCTRNVNGNRPSGETVADGSLFRQSPCDPSSNLAPRTSAVACRQLLGRAPSRGPGPAVFKR